MMAPGSCLYWQQPDDSWTCLRVDLKPNLNAGLEDLPPLPKAGNNIVLLPSLQLAVQVGSERLGTEGRQLNKVVKRCERASFVTRLAPQNSLAARH